MEHPPPTHLPRSDITPGAEFAGYRIERVLGRGGMSVVYLAEHTGLKRRVAVKVLAPQLSDDASFRERFVRESRLAASLDHPNVVPIFEAGEAEGHLFIAMRYVEGTDLRTLIREHGPLDPTRATAIVSQAADALDTANKKGLVHRDVKPANILISEGGRDGADHVYLSDFGLTKRAASDSGITGTGQFVGTMDYAAPEQFQGGRLDATTDVYSLGCVLYECLIGDPPFHRENDAEVMYGHLLEEPPSLTSTRPELPATLDAVAARAMAKRPGDRFPSAGALATAALEATLEDTRDVAAAAPAPSRSRRGMIVAVVAIAAIAGVIAAVLTSRSGSGEETPPSETISLPDDSVTEIDPATLSPIGGSVEGLSLFQGATWIDERVAVGAGGVWVLDAANVMHVDPGRREVEASIPYLGQGLPGTVPHIVAAFRTVWVTSAIPGLDPSITGALERFDPATNEPLPQFVLRGVPGATGVDAGRDAIWTAFSNGTVVEIDPTTLEVRRTFELGGGIDALAVGGDGVWVADRLARTVVRIDARTGGIGDPVSFGGSIDGLAAGGEEVWVLDAVAGTVTQIGESGSVGQPVRVGEDPTDITVGSSASSETLWVTDGGGELYQIDPLSGAVSSKTDLGAALAAVAFDEERGSLWVLVL